MNRISFSILMFVSVAANAFTINPYEIRNAPANYRGMVERISAPAHENLSRLAYGCAAMRLRGEGGCTVNTKLVVPQFKLKTVLQGTRWNDDPNNFFPNNNVLAWLFWMGDGEKRQAEVNNTFALQYRSHYGDLQFLHAMSMGKRNVDEIQADLRNWGQFAYDVASGKIAPDTRLQALKDSHPFVRYFEGTSKFKWTVKKLFTNFGDYKALGDIPTADEDIPALALGALLHTIQDSYSEGHVDRAPGDRRINAWLDYASQDHNCHKGKDKEIAWISKDEALSHPAVLFGTELVVGVAQKKPWQGDVENVFVGEIFKMTDTPRMPDGGACRFAAAM